MLEALRTANVNRQREWDPENKITLLYHATEIAANLAKPATSSRNSNVSVSAFVAHVTLLSI